MVRVALPFGIGTPEAKRGNYRDALRAVGIEPVENVTTLDGFSGLMLAGGSDIDPALYGETAGPQTEAADTERDHLECALFREALERDLPVLGICRGLQLMNVAMGGALVQHIDGHKCPKQREVHAVRIAPGSHLESILGAGEYPVNSRHHQCAARLGARLRVTAAAPDGVVEALELPEARFVLAVQWHPEARLDSPDSKIFAAFRAALADPNRAAHRAAPTGM
jgi:putative glutamine amidotransferase